MASVLKFLHRFGTFSPATSISPPSGPATGSFNGLHLKSNFLVFHMKTRPHHLKASILASIVSLGAISSSHAAVSMIWSGGNDTPLSCTISEPVLFTISGNPGNPMLQFVIQGVGNLYISGGQPTTGDLTYSVNGGTNLTFTGFGEGISNGALNATDAFLMHFPYVSYSQGDTVVLNPGTLTMATNVHGAPPANGLFNMILIDGGYQLVGTQVPEVSSTLLCGLGALGLLRRRR